MARASRSFVLVWALGTTFVFLGCGGTSPGRGSTGGQNGDAGIGDAAGMTGTGGAGSGGSTGAGGAAGRSGSGGAGLGGAGAGGAGAGGAGLGGTPALPCPATPPADKSACAGTYGDTGWCTWGDGARPDCRTRGSCSASAWSIVAPPSYCSAPATGCPSAVPTGFSTCPTSTLACLYANTLCTCPPCNSDGSPGPPSIYCNGQPIGTPVELRRRARAAVGLPIRDPEPRGALQRTREHAFLASGRTLEISAGHPTADGRTLGDLRAGGTLDGQRIESVVVVPYRYPETYDILPASDSGTYFAAGVLIGSTLAR